MKRLAGLILALFVGVITWLALASLASAQSISLLAGGGAQDGVSGLNAVTAPRQLATDGTNLYVAESNANYVKMLDASGTFHVVAGIGTRRPSGVAIPELAPATETAANSPNTVAADRFGVTYFTTASTVVKVDGGGAHPIIDTGPFQPDGLFASLDGAFLYVSDSGNGRVLRYDLMTCAIRCAPPVVLATGLTFPKGLAVATDGTVYVVENGLNLVKRISTTGVVSVVAGGGSVLGDGGPAINARFNLPTQLCIATDGALIIADTIANRVRRVDLSTGLISTIAGNGTANSVNNWATPAPGQSGGTFPINAPIGVACMPSGATIVSTEADGRLYRVSGGPVPTVTKVATTAAPALTATRTFASTNTPAPTSTRTLPPTMTATIAPTNTPLPPCQFNKTPINLPCAG